MWEFLDWNMACMLCSLADDFYDFPDLLNGNPDVAPWIWHGPRTLKLCASSLDFSVPRWVVCYVGKWSPMKYIHVSWNFATVVDYKFCGFLKNWKWEHIYLISRIGEPVLFSVQNSNCFNFLLLKNSGVFGSVHFWWWWHVSAENDMHVHTQVLNGYQNSLVMLRFVDNEIVE
jgi:hypothetical protein